MDGRVSGSKVVSPVVTPMLLNLGNITSYDMNNLVGSEHIGEYSESDFIIQPKSTTLRTNTLQIGDSVFGNVEIEDFTLIYNNSTGLLTITGGKITLSVKNNAATQNYMINGVVPSINLFVMIKTPIIGNPVSTLELIDEPTIIKDAVYTYDENGMLIKEENYKNGIVVETIYYDKNGNPITESEE